LGNLCSLGRHVVSWVLQAQNGSVVPSLANLMERAFQSKDDAVVATEATWAAGLLLCDAGIPNHPSTTLSAPRLIPPILSCLSTIQQQQRQGQQQEMLREALRALWNAVAAPPDESDHSSLATRNAYLRDLLKQGGEPFVGCLVDCLGRVEVMWWALLLTNALLRRTEGISCWWEEANVVDALEHVCEEASVQHAWQSTDVNADAAEMAARLLDDVFYADNSGDDVLDAMADEVFGFGIPTPQEPPPPPQMGRGRGKPTPAWMSTNRPL